MGSGVASNFILSAASTGDLVEGANTYAFTNFEAVDGGAGSDTLDFSGFATARSVTLTASDSEGFDGTEASLAGGFSNIDVLVGGGGTDTLQGRDVVAVSTWDLDGTDTYNDGAQTLAFSAIENLTGGTGADLFDFADGATVAGAVDGGVGGGSDTLDFAAYASARSVLLTASDAAEGFDGTEASITSGFSNIDVLVGGAAVTDTLQGRDAGSTWDLDGTDTYTDGTATLAFSGVENLTGGTGADLFDFADGATVAGALDGGVGGGSDTLDFAAYTSARSVVLTASDAAEGFDGTEASITSGFSNIDVLVGGAAIDTLQGRDANSTWNLDGTDYDDGTASLTFSGIENLTGGTGDDLFDFADGQSVGGALDGGVGGGSDTLDFFDYLSARSVVLTASDAAEGFDGTEASITNGFSNIDVLVGSDTATTDTLQGRDANSTWDLDGSDTYDDATATLAFSGVENLTGGSGNDDFSFFDGAGLGGLVDGGAGTDTADYSNLTAAINLTIDTDFTNIDTVTGNLVAGSTLTGKDGASNAWTLAAADTGTVTGFTDFVDFAELISGDSGDSFTFQTAGDVTVSVTGAGGDDSFIFENNATVTGTLDGLGGSDTLDFSAYTTARDFLLTASDAQGFDGDEAAANANGFSNIDVLVGGTAATDALQGRDAGSTWDLDGTDTYTDGTATLAFSGIENLTGGTGDDVFDFADGATVAGALDGGVGGGSDTLDFAAYTSARSVLLTASDAAEGFGGTEASITSGFSNIDGLVGGAAIDTLQGIDVGSTWGLDGTDTYDDGTATLGFSGVENLSGGTDDDLFDFANGATVAGALDGGVGGGSDTLDFFDYLSARSVVLTASDAAEGFDGTETSITNGFSNIDGLVGSDTATTDSLQGRDVNATTWSISDAVTPTYDDGTSTLTFSGIDALVGGNQDDAFDFLGTNALAVTIDGGVGSDTVDFSLLGGAPVDVVLGAAGILNIESLVGNGGRLTGDSTGQNTWNITALDAGNVTGLPAFSGFAELEAGTLGDTFNFTVGGDNFTGVIFGNTNNDQFVFSDGAFISGTAPGAVAIDGRGGVDILSLAVYTSTTDIDLIDADNADGFDGTATNGGVIVEFDNISTIAGGVVANTLTRT